VNMHDDSSAQSGGARPRGYARVIAQVLTGVLATAALVMLLVGHWDCWQGWGLAALMLGFYWALAPPAGVVTLALTVRTLRRGLSEYTEYTVKACHRLLPGVW
jgi:hypothetical protein